ncbi:helix-turn-helix transcriptional regulator [Streptantibioticus ferralitis]|uniref:Helix-turn-helix transcriptional regulator n=1 Tax=Streptantibioticus ferralitis TaxID=236510 RepID=A0ABT5YZ70_9ACTN|nr:helix-turn-helix transcriptional regulator [Streptantibioticus ferralitis]MDF2256788.1 helix-turn-helix transcriptional regulator [Streptantibioticus ferralitis]
MPESTRNGLGEFLRSRREKLSPEAVGVPDRRRRRTPGLRREEVAELAGIGVDWYIRLEQGRAVSPSVATLDALARVLRLDDVEKDHLRALARGPRHRPFVRERVPEAIQHLIMSLDQPAYVTGRRWDLLAWNDAAAELFIGCDRLPDEDRNILVYLLLDPQARRLFGPGWSAEAQRVVAQFRTTHDLWSADPAFVDLSTRLRRNCPEFAAWWEQHSILTSGNGQKTLHHPEQGVRTFSYTTFQANEHPALKLSIYTPL